MGLILTEGSKNRLLGQLGELTSLVCENAGRETIMWHASKIVPMVISELNYYTPKTTKKKTRG